MRANKTIPPSPFLQFKFGYTMYRILVNIFVEIFIRKKSRASMRQKLLGLPTKMQVLKRAKSVGKYFGCSGLYETRVNKYTVIGDCVGINGLVVMGNGDVIIGNHVLIGAECLILSDNHDYDNGETLPFDEQIIKKKVEIGNYVWIGARCTILPGTKIGEGAIIQAGAVVHGEIPPCAIAGGNPAKVFKYRDIDHYNKIKEKMEHC